MNRGTLWTIPFAIPVIIEGAVGHYVIITVVTMSHQVLQIGSFSIIIVSIDILYIYGYH
jgi:hypothetical protein